MQEDKFDNIVKNEPRNSYHSLDSRLSEDVVRSYAEHLDFAMDVGLLERARIAFDFLPKSNFADRDYVLAVLDRAKEWLPEAEVYEQKNGKGSLFKPNHPRGQRYLRVGKSPPVTMVETGIIQQIS